jgi:hypothetical protein
MPMRPWVGSGRVRWLFLAVGLLAVSSACFPLDAPPAAYAPSPTVYNRSFPDPELVRPTTGSTDLRAFSTNSIYGTYDWPRVPIARTGASTPSGWFRGTNDAFADPPPASWHAPDPRHRWWAPAVAQLGGTWVMYYTAPHASAPDQCIGVATAPDVEGPYTPVGSGPMVCDHGNGGSIDPSVFVDSTGQAWLLWKNDGNCCNLPTYLWSAPLEPDGLAFSGAAQPILGVDQPWEDGSGGGREPWKRLVEGPAMVEVGGAFYLFYSANWWDSSKYAVGYAVCTSPSGGCTKPLNRPLLGSGPNGAGPGGPDVLVDASGQRWLAYHAWTPCCVGSQSTGWRGLHVSRLSFDGAGVPVLGPGP